MPKIPDETPIARNEARSGAISGVNDDQQVAPGRYSFRPQRLESDAQSKADQDQIPLGQARQLVADHWVRSFQSAFANSGVAGVNVSSLISSSTPLGQGSLGVFIPPNLTTPITYGQLAFVMGMAADHARRSAQSVVKNSKAMASQGGDGNLKTVDSTGSARSQEEEFAEEYQSRRFHRMGYAILATLTVIELIELASGSNDVSLESLEGSEEEKELYSLQSASSYNHSDSTPTIREPSAAPSLEIERSI